MMGGDLRAESSTKGPDKGSCFTITFPYVPGKGPSSRKSDETHVEDPRKLVTQSSAASSTKKILVSEDDRVSRRMIFRMLTASGYDVLLATNGQEAVSTYEENRQDIGLVLMDVQMPIMDGYQATKAIREKEQALSENSPCIPIIALSASAMKGDHERGIAHGMTDYLTKPVNLKLLLETLERTLGIPSSSSNATPA